MQPDLINVCADPFEDFLIQTAFDYTQPYFMKNKLFYLGQKHTHAHLYKYIYMRVCTYICLYMYTYTYVYGQGVFHVN